MERRKKRNPDGRLVLTRQVGQSIKINGNITIFVDQIKGSRVRLGVVAPLEIGIVRDDAVKLQPSVTSDRMESGE